MCAHAHWLRARRVLLHVYACAVRAQGEAVRRRRRERRAAAVRRESENEPALHPSLIARVPRPAVKSTHQKKTPLHRRKAHTPSSFLSLYQAHSKHTHFSSLPASATPSLPCPFLQRAHPGVKLFADGPVRRVRDRVDMWGQGDARA